MLSSQVSVAHLIHLSMSVFIKLYIMYCTFVHPVSYIPTLYSLPFVVLAHLTL